MPNAHGQDDLARSLWWQTAPAGVAGAKLQTKISTDLLVIGAGFTGLSCALHAAEMGRTVTVVEAHEPGWGATGRNAGQWMLGWAGRTPASVEKQFGATVGRALNAFNLAATQALPDFIAHHAIEADVRRTGILVLAQSTKQLTELETVRRDWQQFGANIQQISAADLPAYLVTNHYAGGIVYKDGGSLNPLAYARGLANAARKAGAALYDRSPALSMQPMADGWRVTTPQGEVHAGRVAVCTDAYSDALWPELNRSFYRLRLAMLASTPLTAEGMAFMPAGMPFADVGAMSVFGGMVDAHGRFVASFMPGLSSNTSPQVIARGFDAKFRRIFQNHPPHWSTAWVGDVGVVPDRIPKLYDLAPGAMAALGFSGAGIAMATAYGRELAYQLFDDARRSAALPQAMLKSVAFVRTVPLLFRYVAAPVARAIQAF